MSWTIRLYELRKVLLSPVILALLLFFIGLNIMLIMNESYKKEEMSVLNKLVEQFGVALTPQVEALLGQYSANRLSDMNKLTQERTGVVYESAGDFFQYDNFNRYVGEQPELYSQAEIAGIDELRVIDNYKVHIEGIDDTYAGLDLQSKAEVDIAQVGLSGHAADAVRERYAVIAERLEQLIAGNEHKYLFFIGQVYGAHSMLFKTLFQALLFELMILMVLLGSYLFKYEFEQGTYLLHYATKRGRRLQTDKLLAVLAAGSVVTVLLSGVTLAVYFFTFNYSGLWRTSMSSFFNWERDMHHPYISWHEMTFLAYLGCAIALLYVLQLIYIGIVFVLSAFIRSSYPVFACFALLFGASLLIVRVIPRDAVLFLFAGYTPFHLSLISNNWFMASGISTSLKDSEWMIAGGWSLLLALLVLLCLRRFRRQNIN